MPEAFTACAPVRYAAWQREWSPSPSFSRCLASWLAVPLTTSTRSCTGASGDRIGVSSRLPTAAGVQFGMLMPLGTYTAPSRLMGRAALLRTAANAGTMLSSSGSAMVAPRPRSAVRRDRYFFVITIWNPSSAMPIGMTTRLLLLLRDRRDLARLPHLERLTPGDAQDERTTSGSRPPRRRA